MSSADAVQRWSTDWQRHLPPMDAARQAALIADASAAIAKLQELAGQPPKRAFHAACPYATTTAELHIAADLPRALVGAFLEPGASYRVVARFSSAASRIAGQDAPDQRGVALRVVGQGGKVQDLLFTSGSEAHHARDARAMIATLKAASASLGPAGKLGGAATLMWELGLRDGLRVVRTVSALTDTGKSLALIPFFSRSPYRLGDYAVKHRLVPVEGTADGLLGGPGPASLVRDLAERRRQGAVRYRWEAHGFVSPELTSLEDHREAWESPWAKLGELVLPQQAAASEALAMEVSADIDKLSFSPFVRWDEHTLEPLGELNMLRAAYQASVAGSGRHADSRAPLHPAEV